MNCVSSLVSELLVIELIHKNVIATFSLIVPKGFC